MSKSIEYWYLARKLSRGWPEALGLYIRLLWIPLRKKVFGRTPIAINVRIEGESHTIWIRDGADIATLREVFIDGEYDVPVESAPKHIADIGAHIGTASLFFNAKYPRVSITAYEPDPENYQLLVRNTKTIPSIRCIQAAIATSCGERTLYRDSESSFGSSLVHRKHLQDAATVSAIALDDVLADGVDYVKFDIEGAEGELFSNTPALDRCPFYIGEVHHDLIPQTDPQSFAAVFPGFKWDFRRSSSQNRSIMWFMR